VEFALTLHLLFRLTISGRAAHITARPSIVSPLLEMGVMNYAEHDGQNEATSQPRQTEKQSAPQSALAPLSTMRLLANAVRSVFRSRKVVSESASSAEVERRLSICRACPNIVSDGVIPKIVRATTTETSACGLCGCPLMRKARKLNARCPDADPSRLNVNRWGQVI